MERPFEIGFATEVSEDESAIPPEIRAPVSARDRNESKSGFASPTLFLPDLANDYFSRFFWNFWKLRHGGGSAAQAHTLLQRHIFVSSFWCLPSGRAISAFSNGFLSADARVERKGNNSPTSGNFWGFSISAILTKFSEHLGEKTDLSETPEK